MDIRECYRILGLDEGASAAEVRRAYLDLVKTWHPDRFDRSPLLQHHAEETIKQVNAAYARLRRRLPLAARSDPAPSARPLLGEVLGDCGRRLAAHWRGWQRRLRYHWLLMAAGRSHRGFRFGQRNGRAAGRRRRYGAADSFRNVLDQVRREAGRGGGGRPQARTALGRHWLRVLEHHRRAAGRRDGDDPARPVSAVPPVRPVRDR